MGTLSFIRLVLLALRRLVAAVAPARRLRAILRSWRTLVVLFKNYVSGSEGQDGSEENKNGQTAEPIRQLATITLSASMDPSSAVTTGAQASQIQTSSHQSEDISLTSLGSPAPPISPSRVLKLPSPTAPDNITVNIQENHENVCIRIGRR